MTIVTSRHVIQGLEALGIGSCDMLLIYSSLSAMGHVERGAHMMIDSFQPVGGRDGIGVLPTHTWGTLNARQPVLLP